MSMIKTMDPDFRNKTVEDMLAWLENKGYNEWIRESFEGLIYFLNFFSI